MPRLGLILTGPGPHGSFQAGVLDELLYVLDRLNRRRAEDRYRIDGITGVSAGALNGALVAQAVMRGFDRRRFLHETWVEQMDLARLIPREPSSALLSRAGVARVLESFLPSSRASTPSTLAAASLRIRFALTNLTGVDHRLPRRSGSGDSGTVTGTLHAERRDFELVRDDPAADRWDAIREAAVAAGSFPLVFPPYALAADPERWPDHALDPFPARFWYTSALSGHDPVGDAVDLARLMDDPVGGGAVDPDRRLLLVDASADRSTHDPSFSDRTPLLETAGRLALAGGGTATARDWLEALRHDREAREGDDLVGRTLARLVRRLRLERSDPLVAGLAGEADAMVEAAARGSERAGAGSSRARREAAVRGLLDRHAEHAAGLGPLQRELFGTLLFLVNAAGADRRRAPELAMVHADPSRLAGERLHGFAGLFEREWRQHDYTVGRASARRDLPEVLGLDVEELPDPEPAVSYESPVDLRDVTMERAPRASRQALRDALVRAMVETTAPVTAGPVGLRWALGPMARAALRWPLRSRIDRTLAL